MADDYNTSGTATRESLLTMKSVSLVALPWLLYKKEMLQKIKKLNKDDYAFDSFFQAAAGSHVGLMMIIKKRRLGRLFFNLANSNQDAGEKILRSMLNRANGLSTRSKDFLESYETLLDATIAELQRKRNGGDADIPTNTKSAS